MSTSSWWECSRVRVARTVHGSSVAQCLFLAALAAGSVVYVVMFEVLEREKCRKVPGMLQLGFVVAGFAAMLAIEVSGEA